MLEVIPLTGIDEISPGDDLGSVIADALAAAQLHLRRDDVLVVTQKIVSKAEGRFADLSAIEPSPAAIELAATVGKDARFVELVLQESLGVVRAAPNVLITRHRLGLVMANAGIDRSNVPGAADRVLLLPHDPDESARAMSHRIAEMTGRAANVIISDSFGRPWRYGVTGVAIGCWGLPALVDRRGDLDREDRPLEVTQVALADMLAAAASIAMGEGSEGIPVVLIRGCPGLPRETIPARMLVRPIEEDLFQ
jgi:coenzyme F420-0:L-glutamate ligase/coenzyme F420-1:gamma-L-glutamate ligase